DLDGDGLGAGDVGVVGAQPVVGEGDPAGGEAGGLDGRGGGSGGAVRAAAGPGGAGRVVVDDHDVTGVLGGADPGGLRTGGVEEDRLAVGAGRDEQRPAAAARGG